MLPYIEENFAIAKKYDVFKIDETNIIDIITPFKI